MLKKKEGEEASVTVFSYLLFFLFPSSSKHSITSRLILIGPSKNKSNTCLKTKKGTSFN